MKQQAAYLDLLGIPRWQLRQRSSTTCEQAPDDVMDPPAVPAAEGNNPPAEKPAQKAPQTQSTPQTPVITKLQLVSRGEPEWLWLLERSEHPSELLGSIQRAVLAETRPTELLCGAGDGEGDGDAIAASQFEARQQIRCCVVFGPEALAAYRAWTATVEDWPRRIHLVIAPRLEQLAGNADAKRELWGRLKQLIASAVDQ